MATEVSLLPHLQMFDRGISQEYKSRPGRGPTLNLPARDRATHGSALREQLQHFVALSNNLQLERAARNLEALVPSGIIIEFESAPGFDLAFARLDLPGSGIELLNHKVVGNVHYATCFVPEGKLDVLVGKVRDYLERDTAKGNPRNKELVESIQSIGRATIAAFWTDEVPPPEGEGLHWWEVWLRREELDPEACLQRFIEAAAVLELQLGQTWLSFPDRVVINLQATRDQLADAAELLNLIAELRRVDRASALPDDPNLGEQDAFVNGLVNQLQGPAENAIRVTLLDTGVNRVHPLIAPALDAVDMHTVDQAWGTHDHHGHGTSMAGIALYRDLRSQPANQPVALPHRLESVKTLPPNGQPPTAPELFGALTQQAVALCEINAPDRRRVICSTVSSQMHQDGLPSSYSAAVDQVAFNDGEDTRLVVLAAGNVPDELWSSFAASNATYGVEQPGQAWNALTVGAFTEMDLLPAGPTWANWQPIAPAGDLSPFSATSCSWRKWPVKPEVVFEGGNVAIDPAGAVATPASMQLLTTRRNHNVSPIGHTNMTSPACVQAASLSADVMSEYPDFRAETVKALVVHSARWTHRMFARFLTDQTMAARAQLLRACGWGVPKREAALNSLRNRVYVVTEDSLQPFRQQGREGKMNEMKVYVLPWPQEFLEALADTPVRLRITLCYFIEPSPSKRGWVNRYRYSSHALRFDLRRNNETPTEFNKRANAAMLEPDEHADNPADDGWLLGSRLRTHGSTHCDEWTGPAINLLSRDLLAVYPVIGWWRTCTERGECERPANFSLVVSLEVQDAEVDLYSAIQSQLEIPIAADLINTLGA
jgi:hypothetical protein